MLVEVCIDSVESAIAAVNGGADRLELCGNLGVGGGTTPSVGLFRSVKRAVPHVPIMVMIRPRIGDFMYTPAELDTMTEDIRTFKSLGAEGVVFGVLTSDGWLDLDRTRDLVREADGLQVCFHRAFDMTPDPTNEIAEDAPLSQLMQVPGITRVLTSGRGKSVLTSLPTLRNLLQAAHDLNALHRPSGHPLVIIPGSGVNPSSVRSILDELIPLGLSEIHLSGSGWVPGGMLFRKEGLGFGVGDDRDWCIWRTNEDVVREVKKIVSEAAPLKIDPETKSFGE